VPAAPADGAAGESVNPVITDAWFQHSDDGLRRQADIFPAPGTFTDRCGKSGQIQWPAVSSPGVQRADESFSRPPAGTIHDQAQERREQVMLIPTALSHGSGARHRLPDDNLARLPALLCPLTFARCQSSWATAHPVCRKEWLPLSSEEAAQKFFDLIFSPFHSPAPGNSISFPLPRHILRNSQPPPVAV